MQHKSSEQNISINDKKRERIFNNQIDSLISLELKLNPGTDGNEVKANHFCNTKSVLR